jgi:hypothetical protein
LLARKLTHTSVCSRPGVACFPAPNHTQRWKSPQRCQQRLCRVVAKKPLVNTSFAGAAFVRCIQDSASS